MVIGKKRNYIVQINIYQNNLKRFFYGDRKKKELYSPD
jgi:hypothetical protein